MPWKMSWLLLVTHFAPIRGWGCIHWDLFRLLHAVMHGTEALVYSNHPGGGPRVVVSTAAFHARVRGSVPGLGGLKETKLFLPHPRVKVSIVGSLRDREVACSASDRQGSNFESCVWRTVSSQSSHHPQEVLLAQFSLYVHKGGLKPDSFHFFYSNHPVPWVLRSTAVLMQLPYQCRHCQCSVTTVRDWCWPW